MERKKREISFYIHDDYLCSEETDKKVTFKMKSTDEETLGFVAGILILYGSDIVANCGTDSNPFVSRLLDPSDRWFFDRNVDDIFDIYLDTEFLVSVDPFTCVATHSPKEFLSGLKAASRVELDIESDYDNDGWFRDVVIFNRGKVLDIVEPDTIPVIISYQ